MLLEEFPFEPGFRLIDGDQLNKVAAEPAYSVDNTVTATGTSQNTAYNIRATVTVVTAGGDNAGIRLPQPKVGRMIFVLNYTATGKRIYPYDTELINGANSADLPFDMGMVLICTSFGSWAASQVETNTTGDIVLVASDADTPTGDGHTVEIASGAGGTTSGDAGDITIKGGSATNGRGGDIFISGGDGTTDGTVVISAPTVTVSSPGVNFNVVSTLAGNGPSININHAASSLDAVSINGQKNGLMRWSVQLGSGDGESTGNKGSYFNVVPWTDGGAPSLGIAFQLRRTGEGFWNGSTFTFGQSPKNSLVVTPGATSSDVITMGHTGAGAIQVVGAFSATGAINSQASLTVGTTGNNQWTVAPGATATDPIRVDQSGTGGLVFNVTKVGFNATGPIAKPTITGSRGGNAALLSLLTALVNYGLVTDTTTA